ncbi:hypothetical protein BaRGS_00032452 [Batillaria attramentaria]|uniref:Uncharacterized protein n=1 Tax=Batillaria attramentaria TaxID=370345 RepID=A0ABD0JNF8_9CAEN
MISMAASAAENRFTNLAIFASKLALKPTWYGGKVLARVSSLRHIRLTLRTSSSGLLNIASETKVKSANVSPTFAVGW